MRESIFVKQNQEKWARFEKELSSPDKNPDSLRKQLIETTDDLSYARTFYKNRSVRVYLNDLAQKIYINIYKNKRNFRSSLAYFFRDEIPAIAWQNRKTILISFLLLIFSVTIGAFSSAKDEQFARSILSDEYVNYTIENIEKGNPFGIYKETSPFKMFIQIATNNLQVSLIVFIAGILACYGSAVIMVKNGIMLGVFIYFFYSRGLATEFNYTVWLHGTIEILTLVIETTAGMLLGRGLIYPGTLTRYKAFSIYGRKGALLFLSTVPFIIFAAFIESFLTRYTEMPNIIRGGIILGSLIIMVYYFVIYPWLKFRGVEETSDRTPDLKPDTLIEFNSATIYSNAQIFVKSIQFFVANTGKIFRYTFFSCLTYFALLAIFYFKSSIGRFELIDLDLLQDFVFVVFTRNIGKFFDMYQNVSLLFNSNESLSMYLFSSLWIGICCSFGLFICIKHFHKNKLKWGRIILSSLLFSYVLNLLMFIDHPLAVLAYVIAAPLFIVPLIKYNSITYDIEESALFNNIFSGFWRMIGIIGLELLITFMGFIFILSPFTYFIIAMMEMNIELNDNTYTMVLQSIMMFAFMFIVTICLIFFIIKMYFLSHTLHEIRSATGLKQSIEDIGIIHKSYGIETE
ncbi:MAG: stage II sporulation protein M [Bacteroidota bacterium]